MHFDRHLLKGPRHLVLNGSFVFFLTYASYYILLEPIAGLTWTAFLGVPMWAPTLVRFVTGEGLYLSNTNGGPRMYVII